MNVAREQIKNGRRPRPIIAGLMLGLFLLVSALANFEALHGDFHSNSEKADHQCAVTLLGSGQIDLPISAAIILFVSSVFLIRAISKIDLFVSVDYLFQPGRAPPSLA